jgi:ribosomal protein S18 acetylase RimI-like enzyme
MHLRSAEIKDLPAIANLFLRCWTISYASVLSESARSAFDLESAKDLWRTSIENPGDKQTLLMVENEDVVAVFRIGSDKDDPTQGHLFSLYVDPDFAGRGYGKFALLESIKRSKSAGFKAMTLWVFAENERANSLYLKHGFSATGKSRVTPDWGALEIELIANIA